MDVYGDLSGQEDMQQTRGSVTSLSQELGAIILIHAYCNHIESQRGWSGSVILEGYRDLCKEALAIPRYIGTGTLLHQSLEKSELFPISNFSAHLREGSNEATYRIGVTFIDKDGEEHNFQVAQGDNLLDIAQSEDLEMEGTGFP